MSLRVVLVALLFATASLSRELARSLLGLVEGLFTSAPG
jgi:hypothetical protein